MRPSSFPDPRRARFRGRIFASDLWRRSDELFDVLASERTLAEFGGVRFEMLRLPITIPVDEEGLVLLGPATLDCDKVPATMELLRPRDPHTYRLGIGLIAGADIVLRVPGVNATGGVAEPPEPLHELTFAVADTGFAVVAFGPGGEALDVTINEHTAGLLSTALLITFGVKLIKAGRGDAIEPIVELGAANPRTHD